MRLSALFFAALLLTAARADDEPPFDPVYTPILETAGNALSTATACTRALCPSPDCAAYHAASHELSELKRLLGDAEWLASGPSEPGVKPPPLRGNNLTLAYWAAVAREAANAHYVVTMEQLVAHGARMGKVQEVQAWQTFLIDLSKLAATAADILAFKDGLAEALKLDPSKAGETLTTADKVLKDLDFMLELADGVLAFVDLGDLAAASSQRLREAAEASGLGLPDWFQKISAAIQITADVKGIAMNWVEWRNELRTIRVQLAAATSVAPPRLGGTKAQYLGALADHKKKISDAIATAEAARKQARQILRGAATALGQLFLKYATAKAEEIQKELADEVAELATIMSAEQVAATAAFEAWQRMMARNEAVVVLAERVAKALRRLNACEKACKPERPPESARVPVDTFYRDEPGVTGAMARVPQWGVAITWFDSAIAAHAARLDAALALLDATDMGAAKVDLTPSKPSFATGESVTIRFSGSRCLLHQGKVTRDDGEQQATISTGGEAVFTGHKDAGTYEYTFMSPRGADVVTATVNVTGQSLSRCDALNCDCDNIEFGLLTGSYIDQCKSWEAESKQLCAQSGSLRAGACHDTAVGPNPVIPE